MLEHLWVTQGIENDSAKQLCLLLIRLSEVCPIIFAAWPKLPSLFVWFSIGLQFLGVITV